jgi:hypothetical protein
LHDALAVGGGANYFGGEVAHIGKIPYARSKKLRGGCRVFVADNGIATKRNIKIARQDSENAYVESGLNSGDVVILSKVQSGVKDKLNK